MRMVLPLLLSAVVPASAQLQPLSIETIKSAASEPPAFKAAARGVFEYKLESYPKAAGACAPIARKIGEDVARVAKVKVVSSACQGETQDGYTIVVSYEAASALEPVSTTRNRHGAGFGAYESQAACEAALGGEVAAFKEATGLDPVVSYCFSDPLAQGGAWSIRIDSFGAARLKPDVRSTLVFTNPRGWSKEAFTGHIKEKLAAQGVNVRSVTWKPDAGYAELSAAYYGENRITFKMEEPFKVQTQEQCQEALAQVDRVLASRGPEPLIHYCGTSWLGDWELAWLFKDKPSVKTSTASDSFRSYEACAAGKDEVVRRWRESMGHDVLGAACSRADDILGSDWKVVLLE